MSSLHIVYASTSGHTEFVCETLAAFLKERLPTLAVEVQRAEKASAEDLLRGDALLLASGTWNTGGVEGQLNPHMHELLFRRAAEADLGGKPLAFVSLGDTRYYYTARATEHFLRWKTAAKGGMLLPPLTIVNEPYDQVERINAWGEKLAAAMEGVKGKE